MKLSIESLELEGFRSFIKPAKLDLRERGPGLHFMRGKNLDQPRLTTNGVGKSSLWQSIVWCWYGRTSDGLRNPDIEPWFGPSNKTDVAVAVRLDSKPHLFERSTHPNRTLLNGKQASQEQFERALGMSFDTCTNTIIMGQGGDLFFDLQPRHKMDRFADALVLDRWETRAVKASKSTEAFSKTLDEIERDVLETDTKLIEVVASIKRTSTEHDRWEIQFAKTLLASKGELKKHQAECETQQRQYDRASQDYDGAMTELNHYQRELATLRQYAVDTASEIATEQAKLRTNRAALIEAKASLTLVKNATHCPTCGQPLKKTLDGKKRELTASVARLTDLCDVGVPSALLKAQRDISSQINAAIKQEDAFKRKSDIARDTMLSINPRLAESKARVAQLSSNTQQRAKEINPFDDELTRLRNRKRDLTDKLAALKDEKKVVARKMERTRIWIKGFREVRLQLIEDVLQELELTTNAMLDDIGLVDWEIRYGIEKESKSGNVTRAIIVSVLSPYNKQAVRWECFSGGEQQRLRVVGALALSEVLLNHAGVQSAFEVLDEPTHALSPAGIQDLCEFLADRAWSQKKQIWFVDQHAIDSRFFDSTALIVRDRAGSRIDQ